MMILQPHDSARLIAAILHKLGETSITISAHDLQSLPLGQIEATETDDGQTVTYAFRQYDRTGQASLGFDEPVPPLPALADDPMPQTRGAVVSDMPTDRKLAPSHGVLDFETRSPEPLLTVEMVREELRNAAENGHRFEDWTADQIADDLMTYSSACEDADRDSLIALVLEARK